jgi:hypothetical protein
MTGRSTSDREKPTDRYAQSAQPPPGERRTDQIRGDLAAEDAVEEASAESFPASDPPAYSRERTRAYPSAD